jgi:DNA-binding NarL/FixJ family response regulator
MRWSTRRGGSSRASRCSRPTRWSSCSGEAQRAVESLTPRELEVLEALAAGLSDKEISERLHVGIGTVRNHVVSIFNKIGVHSRLQALVFGVRHDVVEIR